MSHDEGHAPCLQCQSFHNINSLCCCQAMVIFHIFDLSPRSTRMALVAQVHLPPQSLVLQLKTKGALLILAVQTISYFNMHRILLSPFIYM